MDAERVKPSNPRSTRPGWRSAEDDVARRFRELAEWWRRDTDVESAPTALFMHPAYQQIIGLGPAVLPFIFSDLKKTSAHWFWALSAITGENPLLPEDQGNVPRMAERWLEWARARELV